MKRKLILLCAIAMMPWLFPVTPVLSDPITALEAHAEETYEITMTVDEPSVDKTTINFPLQLNITPELEITKFEFTLKTDDLISAADKESLNENDSNLEFVKTGIKSNTNEVTISWEKGGEEQPVTVNNIGEPFLTIPFTSQEEKDSYSAEITSFKVTAHKAGSEEENEYTYEGNPVQAATITVKIDDPNSTDTTSEPSSEAITTESLDSAPEDTSPADPANDNPADNPDPDSADAPQNPDPNQNNQKNIMQLVIPDDAKQVKVGTSVVIPVYFTPIPDGTIPEGKIDSIDSFEATIDMNGLTPVSIEDSKIKLRDPVIKKDKITITWEHGFDPTTTIDAEFLQNMVEQHTPLFQIKVEIPENATNGDHSISITSLKINGAIMDAKLIDPKTNGGKIIVDGGVDPALANSDASPIGLLFTFLAGIVVSGGVMFAIDRYRQSKRMKQEEAFSGVLSQMQTSLKSLEKQLQKTEESFNEKFEADKADKKKAVTENQHLDDLQYELKQKLQILENKIKDTMDHTQNQAQNQSSQSNAEVANLQKQCTSLHTALTNLQSTNADLDAENRRIQTELTESQREVDSLNAQIVVLKRNSSGNAVSEETKATIEKLQQENATLRNENNTLQIQNDTLKQAFSNMNTGSYAQPRQTSEATPPNNSRVPSSKPSYSMVQLFAKVRELRNSGNTAYWDRNRSTGGIETAHIHETAKFIIEQSSNGDYWIFPNYLDIQDFESFNDPLFERNIGETGIPTFCTPAMFNHVTRKYENGMIN